MGGRQRTGTTRRLAVLPVLLAALLMTLAPSTTTAAVAGPAPAGANPLAGGPWGVYRGSADGVFPAWQLATGETRELLSKVALRPRMRWFGHWIPAADIADSVRDHISKAQDGDTDVLVQMAVFRLWPQRESAKDEPLTRADRQAYRHWVDNAASAIGSARVAMVLEPDLAVALKGWRPAVRLRLAKYAAGVFGALPNTSVYLDASDADWLKEADAVSMLLKAGIQHVRGFALGATHYGSTAANIGYGTRVVDALAEEGVPGRHFVIDTADNGRPFTWLQFHAAHPGGDFDNANVCRTTAQRRCVTLGIPPTSDVAADRWNLPEGVLERAAEHVDAYLWFGRPWLTRQAAPFNLARTLAIARTTPY